MELEQERHALKSVAIREQAYVLQAKGGIELTPLGGRLGEIHKSRAEGTSRSLPVVFPNSKSIYSFKETALGGVAVFIFTMKFQKIPVSLFAKRDFCFLAINSRVFQEIIFCKPGGRAFVARLSKRKWIKC